MSIEFRCGCGRLLKAPDSAAGRIAQCPACRQRVRVPQDSFEVGPAQPVAETADGEAKRGPAPAPTPPPGEYGLTIGAGRADSTRVPEMLDQNPYRSAVMPPTRAQRTAERSEVRERFGMGQAFIRALTYPFFDCGWIMLIFVPIGAFAAGFFPLVGILFACGIYYGWLIQVIHCASRGPQAPLEWGEADFWFERVWPAVKIVANFIVILAVPTYLTHAAIRRAPPWSEDVSAVLFVLQHTDLLIMWLAVSFVYVMSFTIVATFGAFWSSLNPYIVFVSIKRVFGEYVMVWMFSLFMYVAVEEAALAPLRAVSKMGALIAGVFVRLYILTVIVARLGFMAYRNQEELGWG